jgi:hypothetical protein
MTLPLRTRDDRGRCSKGSRAAPSTRMHRITATCASIGTRHPDGRLHEDPTRLLGIDARCLWDSRSAATSAWGSRGWWRWRARRPRGSSASTRRRALWRLKRCRHRRLGSVHAEHAHAREHQRCPRLVALRRPGHSGNPAPCARPRRPSGGGRPLAGCGPRGEYLPVRRVAAPV